MMRPSEALALGRVMLKPLAGVVNDQKGNGCALGMIGSASSPEGMAEMTEWMLRQIVRYPCECAKGCNVDPMVAKLRDVVIHLFDHHVEEAVRSANLGWVVRGDKWNLDQLIDWLRKVEDEQGFVEKETEECTSESRALDVLS